MKLSQKQRTTLVLLASEGYARAGAADGTGLSFDVWRRMACDEKGLPSLSQAEGKHYLRLRALFRDLKGDVKGALQDYQDAENEDLHRVQFAIARCMKALGVDAAWVAAVLRDMELPARWEALKLEDAKKLLMTLESRRRARAKAVVK